MKLCLLMFVFVSDCSVNPREWCKLAYWEMAKRVGPLFPVELPYINIFGGDVPYGDGLCLETLALSHHSFLSSDSIPSIYYNKSSAIEPVDNRTRHKIGLGKFCFPYLPIFKSTKTKYSQIKTFT